MFLNDASEAAAATEDESGLEIPAPVLAAIAIFSFFFSSFLAAAEGAAAFRFARSSSVRGIGKLKPLSLPRLATPTPQVNCVR